MSEQPRNIVSYSLARHEIRDGDLLLFRPRDWYTRLIAVAGRSEYVHAAMAAWWNQRLMNVEMTSGGGRAQLLSNIVERWPGAIDVYRANATHRRFSREAAVRAMIGITGKKYGWWNLLRAACGHLPLVRLLLSPDCNDTENTPRCPPFCSEAVAMACRRAGVDPVPNLPDRLTEPADLSRSPFYAYRFTLIWEAQAELSDQASLLEKMTHTTG
ncbi:MAG: hypothetical protein LLG00_10490 [Planctomycetaceae bacterium]|nr:hypothetical protein [Planctomycetaceae bacterium]